MWWITVLWDVMLDKFSYGSVKRLNPESPAPLITVDREEYKLWWAANVAANIAWLEQNVQLIWLLWKDFHGAKFEELCKEYNIDLLKIISWFPTITKQRFIENTYRHQLLRADYEEKIVLDPTLQDQIISQIKTSSPDYLVISDYLKWTITEELIKKIRNNVDNILVDTKPEHIHLFEWVYLIKPNFKEFCKIMDKKPDDEIKNTDQDIEKYWVEFVRKYNTNLVVTRWSEWASLITKDGYMVHLSTNAQQVFDVTGAWDTFLASITVALKEWKSLEDSVKFGNKASGVVVGKVGTAIIQKKDII